MRARRTMGHRTTSVLLALACLALAVVAFGFVTQRFRLVPVLSGSMRPAIEPGSVAIVTPKPLEDVRRGDAIVYEIPVDDHRLVVHRVHRVIEPGGNPLVRTKGDANDTVDRWRARLQGDEAWTVRASIPYVGYAAILARRPLVRTAAMSLAIAILLVVALSWIWRGGRESASSGAGELSDARLVG